MTDLIPQAQEKFVGFPKYALASFFRPRSGRFLLFHRFVRPPDQERAWPPDGLSLTLTGRTRRAISQNDSAFRPAGAMPSPRSEE
jgi:hypothetical protein